jgi:hypothetical protein
MGLAFLKKAAPWIATVVGVAVPAAAPFLGVASKLLTNGLGKTVAPTADAITSALSEAMANPDQLAKLKQIDDDFAVQMKQLGIESVEDFEKIAADDRASARNREIQVRDWTPRVLAYAVISAFIFVCVYVLSGHAKVETVLAGTLIGYISAKAELVLTYYFGSSADGERKTELLAQAPPVQK